MKDASASTPKTRIKHVAVKKIDERIGGRLGGRFTVDEKMNGVIGATSKSPSGSGSSSDESLSQLNDSDDEDAFDGYVDRDVIEKELRSWIQSSNFFGDKQPIGREPESSSGSEVRSLGSDSDSNAAIRSSDYSEFNETIDVKRTITLSVGMRFSNAAQFRKVQRLYSI